MMAELYNPVSRSTLNASHRLNCAFFTVCWEIGFPNNMIQDLLFHQCKEKQKEIDFTLAWLRSSHRGRHKNVLSAHSIAEFM